MSIQCQLYPPRIYFEYNTVLYAIYLEVASTQNNQIHTHTHVRMLFYFFILHCFPSNITNVGLHTHTQCWFHDNILIDTWLLLFLSINVREGMGPRCGQGDMVSVRAESEDSMCGRIILSEKPPPKGELNYTSYQTPCSNLHHTIISVCHLLRHQDIGLNELVVDANHD